jgi:hypothetical protein
MITERHFQQKNIRGYKWCMEYSEFEFGYWVGKAFLGGMIRFTTRKVSSLVEAQLELSNSILDNSYFK